MNTMTKEQILNAFQFRHACKEFDASKKISDDDFNFILETIRLSPSSYGSEAWKFLVIQNENVRNKLLSSTWGAQKQLPTASHFIIALHNTGEILRHDASLFDELFKKRNLPKEIDAFLRQKVKEFQEVDFDLLSTDRALSDWAGKQLYTRRHSSCEIYSNNICAKGKYFLRAISRYCE